MGATCATDSGTVRPTATTEPLRCNARRQQGRLWRGEWSWREGWGGDISCRRGRSGSSCCRSVPASGWLELEVAAAETRGAQQHGRRGGEAAWRGCNGEEAAHCGAAQQQAGVL